MRNILFFLLPFTFFLLISCSRPEVPAASTPVGRLPHMRPDYADVTIPCNIAPLNFAVIEIGSQQILARFTAPDGTSYVYGGSQKVLFDADEWRELLSKSRGSKMQVEVYASDTEDRWVAFTPFSITVANDSIDPYISYRLIQPSYVGYEELRIEQRCLEDFSTRDIYNNMCLTTETKGQCINCHSYQNYSTDNMLFHMRKDWGGTIIVRDGGKPFKVNLKTPETISAGVYPAWHPTLPLIAFSTDKTAQSFYTIHNDKVEVFDAASDLILYDLDHNEISNIQADPEEMEIFPTWSPDGRWLYYGSAHIRFGTDGGDAEQEAMDHCDQVRYDLYRLPFDPATHQFGERQLVYAASADSMSATLPRLSPDGQYLVFSRAPYGCFHVWHHEADIYAIRLQDSAGQPLDSLAAPFRINNLNSDCSESYPTFSSNGRWLMTASRRDDGNYTRPYIAYFTPDGQCHKPFELPQENPAFYTLTPFSFNRPEFMRQSVSTSVADFAEAAKRDAVNARFLQ